MLKATGREQEGSLDTESIETFPCADLRTIDCLWVKYSDGRFGFSVQKRIWESVGGKPGEYDYEIYCEFGDRVGWRVKGEWFVYSNIFFSLNAPQGHLPWVCVCVVWSEVMDVGRKEIEKMECKWSLWEIERGLWKKLRRLSLFCLLSRRDL
jgi:hypothetical protein